MGLRVGGGKREETDRREQGKEDKDLKESGGMR